MTDYTTPAATGPDDEVAHPPIVENDGTVVLAPTGDETDDRPAAERITDLFDHMPGSRAALLTILEACRAIRAEEEVIAEVDAVLRQRHSVYSALGLCGLLERAGALRHVREDGASLDEASLQPEVVIEDGIEYLQPVEPPASYWLTTEAGALYAQADDPASRVREIVDAEGPYASVYKYILETCARGGVSGRELGGVIEALELTQEPRRYATYFIKRLEDAGAIVWDGAWSLSGKVAGSLGWLDAIAPLEGQGVGQ